jgi:hypothetical protein
MMITGKAMVEMKMQQPTYGDAGVHSQKETIVGGHGWGGVGGLRRL